MNNTGFIINVGLGDFISEFESFCRKRKLTYTRNDRGISIKSSAGLFNVHIYMKWDNYERVIIGFVIGESIYSVNNATRLENNLGYVRNVSDMLIIRSYLQNTYPEWLALNRTWKSRSKYK